MAKVERELLALTAKAKDQELRLANDERLIKLQSQLTWFRDELTRLSKMREENFNKIEMLSTRVQTMQAEKRFMEEQVKASKRQGKLLVMALGKQEGMQAKMEADIDGVHQQNLDIRKQQVQMPPAELNPFMLTQPQIVSDE